MRQPRPWLCCGGGRQAGHPHRRGDEHWHRHQLQRHVVGASTLTSLDDRFSQKWESGAALPNDRIEAIKKFHEKGIFTWVSLEPTLDVDASIAIIERTHEFVDLFKIGRVNYMPMTKTTDWEDYTHRIIDVCDRLGVAHYIKKDLQPYLPDDYKNPLRVKQHH